MLGWLLLSLGVGGLVVSSVAAFVRRRRRSLVNYVQSATSFGFIDVPPTLTAVGATTYCRAAVLDQFGRAMLDQSPYTIGYTSVTTADVTVGSSTGLCTAVANGSSVITASATGYTSITRTVTVAQQPASISGVSSTLSTDDASSGTFSPTAKDANNNTIAGATFTYASNNNSVITVDASGNWAGQSAGTTTIDITSGAVTVTVSVTVVHAATPNAPTASNATGQTASSLTIPVTLAASGSLPTKLAWRYSTDNATWTNGTDITLTSPSLGQEIDETVSVPSAATLYYVQFAAKNTAGTSSFCTSVTGTTSAASLPPVFTSISPTSIAQNTSGTFSIVGDRLTADTVLTGLTSGLSQSGFTLTDAQHATVTLSATATATTGTATLGLSNSNGTSTGTASLTVNTGTPSGTARSLFTISSAAASTHPSAGLSTTLPLAKNNGTIGWQSLAYGYGGSGGTSPFVQTTQGSPQSATFKGFVSPPLSEQFIPAGTYTFKMSLYAESASSYRFALSLKMWRPSTNTVVGTLYDSATGIGSVAGTSSATMGKVITITNPSPIAIQTGDVMVLEVYAVGDNNTFVHFGYDGNGVAITEGNNGENSELDFPSAIYSAPSPLGKVSIGPTGFSTQTGALTAVTVANDAEYRSKMVPSSSNSLWDSTQTSRLGTSAGILDISLTKNVDLCVVSDGVTSGETGANWVQFTDRDSVARNTFHVMIRPGGGAPISSANDSLATQSTTPEAAWDLPAGRGFRSYLERRLIKFKPGFRIDCPNNPSAYNLGTGGYAYESASYKIGPDPSCNTGRDDWQMTNGTGTGADITVSPGVAYDAGAGTVSEESIGNIATLMPGWNTNGDVWEMVRAKRIQADGTCRMAVYIGKLTDATLTKVFDKTMTLKASAWPTNTTIGLLGKNFNRQLGSTDAMPEYWVGDTQWWDLTESGFTWPSQIAVGDRI